LVKLAGEDKPVDSKDVWNRLDRDKKLDVFRKIYKDIDAARGFLASILRGWVCWIVRLFSGLPVL